MGLRRLPAISVISFLLILATVLPAAAESRDRDDAVYLALGDSVAFGFNPLLNPSIASNFVGYPEVLAEQLDLHVTNASCPGEASGGFISLTGIDGVCRPYRAAFPLHVNYTTSQLDFAVTFLQSHPRTRLITLNVGANDLFVLQRQCAGSITCIQNGLPGLLSALSANLTTIYTRLERSAPYHHQVVALTYYALNYTDPVGVQLISAINNAVTSTTLASGGRVADGFDAFKVIAEQLGGGDSCAAGLLIALPGGGCDIHPTLLGHQALAQAIGETLPRDLHN